MKEEVSAAVMFLTHLISKSKGLDQCQLETFETCLNSLLMEKFKDHWFPDKPFKGQAYRCIRVNETERRDPVLEKAAQSCGLNYEDLKLPVELTIWVDPNEVCCRFGEHKGSYCTVASFKGGNKENFVDKIDIDELAQKTKTKKVPLGVAETKKVLTKNGISVKQSETNGNPASSKNVLQPLVRLSPLQGYRSRPHLYNFNSMAPSQVTQPNSFHVRVSNSGSTLYSRHPSRYTRNYYHNAAVYSSSQYQRSLFGSHSHISKNDRYHWVNRSNAKV